MIPWVREKLERRAKWFTSVRRKRSSFRSGSEPPDTSPAADAERQQELGAATSTPLSRPDIAVHLEDTSQDASTSALGPSAGGERAALRTPRPERISKLKNSRRSSSCSTSGPNSPLGSSNNSNDTITERLHPKETIKVRIICPSARLLAFQSDVNKRLSELKNEVILELSDDPASLPLFATDVRQLSPRYRLFRAEYEGSELNETLTLAQLQIGDNETLVLVGRRSQLQQKLAQTREIQTPRDHEIEVATRNLPENTVEMPMVDINEIFQQSNLQFDVRKVLISLAQVSATIIGSGPYAKRLIEMLKQKLINKRNYQNDTLQCLIDMGFKREKAEYALKTQHGVYAAALEWLIQRQSEDMTAEEASIGIRKSHSIMSPSGILTDDGVIENTEALLEIVRIYSHRDIPPSPDTMSSLVEMGFEEEEVVHALKKTCNNKAAACEWLCGNRSGSLVELREGLAQDSPILKSILELPQVQMNLSNPKILLAFLAILENENSIRVWGGDNDTSSVITHILQKYHEEKHVLGINQFYNNR